MVSPEYPNGVTLRQYKKLIARNPRLKNLNWREMRRNASVFVRGRVSHQDHATLVLDGWHRVLMNRERRVDSVAFLD